VVKNSGKGIPNHSVLRYSSASSAHNKLIGEEIHTGTNRKLV